VRRARSANSARRSSSSRASRSTPARRQCRKADAHRFQIGVVAAVVHARRGFYGHALFQLARCACFQHRRAMRLSTLSQ
jgi:hypothetical protein